jgi:glycosyltransferase involved in cell wall biosynthesis
MSNKETISILITCLNGERYIKRCIDSILNQTYQNFIIIFLNDGSVDNTKKIISEYNNEKIKYFENEKNMGRGYSRNKLLSLSETEYSCWCDIDDFMDENKLDIQISYMTSNDVNFLATEMFDCDNDGNVLGLGCNKKENIESLTYEMLLQNNSINHPTVMFKTNIAKLVGFNENFYFNEDWDFYKRAYKLGYSVKCIDKPLYFYKL